MILGNGILMSEHLVQSTWTHISVLSLPKGIRLIFKLICSRFSPHHVSSHVDYGMCFALSSCPVLPLPIFCIFS